MPKTIIRPTTQETAAIDALFRRRIPHSAATLRKLLILSEWANGKSLAEAGKAQEPPCSRETVRRIVAEYLSQGLKMFERDTAKPRGRPPIPEAVRGAIIARLRECVQAGKYISYATLAAEFSKGTTKVSRSKVAKIAKAARLDTKNRRGQVEGRQ